MWFEGVGLHTGERVRARWVLSPGRLKLRRVDGRESEVLVSLRAARMTPRAARIRLPDGRSVDTLEHMLSALGARGCFEGVSLEVDGPECPLLDGTASPFCHALEPLPASEARFFVHRAQTFTYKGSSLSCLIDGAGIEVITDFRAQSLGEHTLRWDGDWTAYREGIAPARTFGFARDAEALAAMGLARGASLDSVVVFTPEGGADGRFARPASEDEHARHKLLDAIGDVALLGGSVRGRLCFLRPGHARTLGLLRMALASGAIARAY